MDSLNCQMSFWNPLSIPWIASVHQNVHLSFYHKQCFSIIGQTNTSILFNLTMASRTEKPGWIIMYFAISKNKKMQQWANSLDDLCQKLYFIIKYSVCDYFLKWGKYKIKKSKECFLMNQFYKSAVCRPLMGSENI